VTVLRQAGYAVIRAPDSAGDRPMAVTLMAGERSRAHHHLDKLAITLWARGRELLGGTGYPGYYDARRAELRTGLHHNGVTADGRSQREGAARWVQLPDVDQQGRAPWRKGQPLELTAGSDLLAGIEHTRSLVVGPTPGAVWLIDRLKAAGPRRFEVRFRPAAGLEARADRGCAMIGDGRPGGRDLLRICAYDLVNDGAPVACEVLEDGRVACPVSASSAELVTILEDPAARAAVEPAGRALVWRGSGGRYEAAARGESR